MIWKFCSPHFVHFLSWWLSGIIAIMNSSCESDSPRKIPLWIFTESLLKSPDFLSVFWPRLIILKYGLSPLKLWFLSLPVPLPSLWGLFRAHHLQLISPLPSCSILAGFFLVLSKSLATYLSFHFLLFYFVVPRNGKMSTIRQVSLFFIWLSLGLVVWPRLGDLFVSQNPREFCTSHSPGWILG